MPKRDYLFVYGTLRKHPKNPLQRLLAQHTAFAEKARFQGKLYDIGRYPGAVPSKQASDVVRGELYALRDRDLILRALDEYEGPHFRRRRVSISLDDGKKVRCWIYLFTGPTEGFKPIAAGDYLKFLKAKRAR